MLAFASSFVFDDFVVISASQDLTPDIVLPLLIRVRTIYVYRHIYVLRFVCFCVIIMNVVSPLATSSDRYFHADLCMIFRS